MLSYVTSLCSTYSYKDLDKNIAINMFVIVRPILEPSIRT